MKRIVLVIFIMILLVSVIGCSDKKVSMYPGYENIPNYGEFDEEATLLHDVTEKFRELNENTFVYSIPGDDTRIEDYIVWLTDNGFQYSTDEKFGSFNIYNHSTSNERVAINITETYESGNYELGVIDEKEITIVLY